MDLGSHLSSVTSWLDNHLLSLSLRPLICYERNNNTAFLSAHPHDPPSKLLEVAEALAQSPSLRTLPLPGSALASCLKHVYQPLADSTPGPLQNSSHNRVMG